LLLFGTKISHLSIIQGVSGLSCVTTDKPAERKAITNIEPKVVNLNLSLGKINLTNPFPKIEIRRTDKTKNSKRNTQKKKTLKFDPTYEKEGDAIATAILMMIVYLIVYAITKNLEENEETATFIAISSVISLILRILFTNWATRIADRQNRDKAGWGVFTFFFPLISLIILGSQKRLLHNFGINETKTDTENSEHIAKQATVFFEKSRYKTALFYAEKALELNSENELAKYIKEKADEIISKKVAETEPKTDLIVSYETLKGIITVHIPPKDQKYGYILKLGHYVYLEGKPAPDGRYKISYLEHIIVKDGKIEKIPMF